MVRKINRYDKSKTWKRCKIMKNQRSGWHGESRRHSLARKNIKTIPSTMFAKGRTIDLTKKMTPEQEEEYENDINSLLSLGLAITKLTEGLDQLYGYYWDDAYYNSKEYKDIYKTIGTLTKKYNDEVEKVENKYNLKDMFKRKYWSGDE